MGSIQFDRVSKKYGSHQVISDVSLEVKDGEFVVFVGPSGCGKSSLLRLITGLEQLSDGRVLIDGKDVSRLAPADRRIAMVFQSYALYPHMSVRDNIGFGLKIAGMSRQEIAGKVAEASRILALEDYLDRKPRQLSGGQRQRVAIGRAIVRSPTAFLFDEPLSNLDAALRVQMRIELIRLHRTLRTTMIYVTHDQVEAMTMADRIVVLRAGNVEQFSTPLELYDHPANLFVASFIGSPKMNFLPAAPSGDRDLELPGGSTVALPDGWHSRLDQKMTLGIRPEHVLYSPDEGLWEGTVSLEEQLGSDALLYVEVPSLGTITVRAVGERRFKTGDRIFLTPDASRVHLFDGGGTAIAA
ncbi:sn-glycerol-3-phosphate ABC transporter ATP-binding protein UgpC [Labrys neptuniae]|uniref:Sn-glycerol-3-phosphate ABC transporter ATP-binding protein UgpC n=1 Tax=Labrys neptuniae TaxID=376174 RepID=A0ABV3PNQ9_9HYPH|nr:sn-glycerol-3-phosphate ABC transporter ATP-binding protein UgpC [Labrys neptuniae]MDT3378304.1 sn-glycerol-3-phosphate ABC transporter ATP-binding protein UgpC [Labrys neptuniae]